MRHTATEVTQYYKKICRPEDAMDVQSECISLYAMAHLLHEVA